MINRPVSIQAKEYLFDLRNTTIENGLKPDKLWQLRLVSKSGKIAIEKQYRASVSVEPGAAQLAPMLRIIEAAILLPVTETVSMKTILVDELQYLIAYNPSLEWR
jgi:hypothetical protein